MENLGKIVFSEEQAELLDVASVFCREKSPVERVRALMESGTGYDAEIWEEVCELGWAGIAVPEEYGGVGLSFAEVVPVVEQMGRRLMALPYVSTVLAAELILKAGTEHQKNTILPKLVAGSVATAAMMEPQGRWDFASIAAIASEKDGDFVLSGQKLFVCDAEAAEYIIVPALFENSPNLFLITRDQVVDNAIRREKIIDERKRACALQLDGIRVSSEARMSETLVPEALRHYELTASLLSAAEACGSTQACIEYTVDYLNTRKQFGKLIGSYQALKHPTVDAFVQYLQTRSHVYSAASSYNQQGTGEVAVRMARVMADKALSFAADRSIQYHGGFGFTYECDAQLYRRSAIWHASQFGDAAYHKKKLAELLL